MLLRSECSLLESCQRLEIVAIAHNGQEAIDRVRQHQPDLVLMDVQMPAVNGLESASRITQEFPSVRVVHISTHQAAALQKASEDSGARCLVLKSALGLRYCQFVLELFGSCEPAQGDQPTPGQSSATQDPQS